MITIPLPLDTDHHRDHHSGGSHPIKDSIGRGAGWGAGRDIEHLVFKFLENHLGATVIVAIITVVAAVFLVRWLLTRRANTR